MNAKCLKEELGAEIWIVFYWESKKQKQKIEADRRLLQVSFKKVLMSGQFFSFLVWLISVDIEDNPTLSEIIEISFPAIYNICT